LELLSDVVGDIEKVRVVGDARVQDEDGGRQDFCAPARAFDYEHCVPLPVRFRRFVNSGATELSVSARARPRAGPAALDNSACVLIISVLL
jgi:hypothetical protein